MNLNNPNYNLYLDILPTSYIYGEGIVVTMENLVNRKKSLEEEIKLCEWMFAFEHHKEMKNKIRVYLNQVQRELLYLLR